MLKKVLNKTRIWFSDNCRSQKEHLAYKCGILITYDVYKDSIIIFNKLRISKTYFSNVVERDWCLYKNAETVMPDIFKTRYELEWLKKNKAHRHFLDPLSKILREGQELHSLNLGNYLIKNETKL